MVRYGDEVVYIGNGDELHFGCVYTVRDYFPDTNYVTVTDENDYGYIVEYVGFRRLIKEKVTKRVDKWEKFGNLLWVMRHCIRLVITEMSKA